MADQHQVVVEMIQGKDVISEATLEAIIQTENTVQQSTVEPATQKPFLLRFDVTKVGKPGQALKHHVPGVDPVWVQFENTWQFIDQATKDRPRQSLAVWSIDADAPYFFDFGYMKVNPMCATEFKFVWRPDEDPFPTKIGNYFLLFLMGD